MLDLHELLTRPRRQARSLAELLPWFGLLGDDTVLCSDGSLLVGYRFAGCPLDGAADDLLALHMDWMQLALRGMGQRVTLWSYLDRRFDDHWPAGETSHSVARRIEADWRGAVQATRHARLEHHLYLGYALGPGGDALFEKVGTALNQGDASLWRSLGRVLQGAFQGRGTLASVQGQLGATLSEFAKLLDTFEALAGPRLGFVRLRSSALLGGLHARANLASLPGDVRACTSPSYLATALACDTLTRHHHQSAGDQLAFQGPAARRHVCALSTTGMPAHTYGPHLDQLMALPCEFTLCQRFEFLDTDVAQRAIQRAEQYYRMEVKSLSTRVAEKLLKEEFDKVNTGHLRLAEDAQEALAELTSSDVSYGYHAMTVLAQGATPQEAARSASLVEGQMRANGYTLTREVQGLLSAYLCTLPGLAQVALRKTLASSANLADLIALRTLNTGEASHTLFSQMLGRDVPALLRFPTADGVAYDFSPHEADLGHTAIVGGSGAGKSTLMQLWLAQFQKYAPCNTYIFDKDHSMCVMALLLGGQHIDLAAKAGARIGMNPVRRMLAANDALQLRRWVEVLITAANGADALSAQDNDDLYAAIQEVQGLDARFWRLGHIYTLVRSRNADLALKLSPYIDRSTGEADGRHKGPFAEFFDNDEDAFSLSTLVAMETGRLLMTPQIASPLMDYAFYCIEQRLDGRTPTLIYVEEAWYLLSHPLFAAKMDDWLRTFRKKGAFLVFATQSVDELVQLKSIGAFLSNVPTRIFLPSMHSSVAAQATVYRQLFGLNDAQLDLLGHALPKRDYLIVKASGTKLVQAPMPPLVVAINAATARNDWRERCLALAREDLPGWQDRFLEDLTHASH